MELELKLHRLDAQELLKDYVERRLNFSLSRFGESVRRVTTRISVSDSSESQEITCRMTADLPPFGVIVAEARDADVYTAIDRCSARLARRCESKLERPRSARSGRESIRTARLFPAA